MAWKTGEIFFHTVENSGRGEVREFGRAGPGEDAFAPEAGGETGGQVRGGFRGGFADEIEPVQFAGQIGQQEREPFAVAAGQRGVEILGMEPGLGGGRFTGPFSARGEGGDQAPVGGSGFAGSSGWGEGVQDFRERGRGQAGVVAGPGGRGSWRTAGAGGEGAEQLAVAGAQARAEGLKRRGVHQANTTVRFL